MYKKRMTIVVLAGVLTACSTIGQLTVKDYEAKSGQRVMAGQAEPKADYKCAKLAQERHDWGMKGNMDKAGATQRVTAAAVEGAPGRGANYAHVVPPSDTSIGGVNINTFKDAQVAYYKCTSLPAK
jgi:hypothetical protein